MPDVGRQSPHSRPRVVIVGGGFAGVNVARGLRDAPVDVTLLDRTNHYLFQPLLYQVATGVLSPADIAVPTRFLVRRQRNAEVLLANVDGIDLKRRTVTAEHGALTVPFDYLVVATGARHSYFGHPEWEPLAPGLKTLDDAREIRRRFLMALERAEQVDDPAEQAAWLTVVIIGGGPTGVELAGILPPIVRRGFRRDFRHADLNRLRVILLEGGPRLLPAFPEALSARACRDLEQLGVTCRTGALVTNVTPDAVYLGDERIPTRTAFWAAGNAASPLIASMGIPVDRAGRALVRADLTVPDHPHVFVIGDSAAVPMGTPPGDHDSPTRPQWVPGLAAAANQMGTHTADAIRRSLEQQPAVPFVYHHRGSLAVIGRGRALADFGRFKLTGRPAFFTWFAVHLMYLAGFRNRISVTLEWAYAYFTFRPGARLLTRADVEALHEERSRPAVPVQRSA